MRSRSHADADAHADRAASSSEAALTGSTSPPAGEPGYRLRLLAADIAGSAVVVAVFVVDDEGTDDLPAGADAVVTTMTAAAQP